MSRQSLAAVACIMLCIGGMVSSGCGLFSYPGDGAKALSTNAAFIKFDVHIVDQAGTPLDGVTVHVVRHALTANILMWGTYDEAKPDSPYVVYKVFTYYSAGNCAVTATFTKPGYADTAATYANVDVIKPQPAAFMGPPVNESYPCINVCQHPTQTITMTKTKTVVP